MFCTAAPEAPFPRLSSLATSHAMPSTSLAYTESSSSFVSFSVSGRKKAPRSKSSTPFRARTETNRDPA